jgi:hypothetical protein
MGVAARQREPMAIPPAETIAVLIVPRFYFDRVQA